MARYRQIKKYGNTFVIAIFHSDMKDLKLSEGDIVDLDDIVIVNKTSGRKDNNASRELPKSRSNKLKVKSPSKKKVAKLKRGNQ